MIQRQITHAPGTFLRCAGCAREPRHIQSHGRGQGDISDPRSPYMGARHHLECAHCGRVTARAETLDAAISEWGVAYAQQTLPLRIVSRRRAVA